MTRKWLLTIGLFVVGTATLFGCGNKEQNAEPTTEATTEASTEAPEITTEATSESTTEASTEEPETTTELTSETTTEASATTEEKLVPKVTKKQKGTGIFNGQIDSSSVEIEMENGQPETFFIYKEEVAEAFNNMDIGAKISFTYGPAKGQINPQILSVKEQ